MDLVSKDVKLIDCAFFDEFVRENVAIEYGEWNSCERWAQISGNDSITEFAVTDRPLTDEEKTLFENLASGEVDLDSSGLNEATLGAYLYNKGVLEIGDYAVHIYW